MRRAQVRVTRLSTPTALRPAFVGHHWSSTDATKHAVFARLWIGLGDVILNVHDV
jgi:hypothetical protein